MESGQSGQGNYSSDVLRNPRKDDEIVASLKHDISSAEFIMAPYQRLLYEAILWTSGEQYMEWNHQLRRFMVRQSRPFVPRSTTNHILPNVELGVALFMDSMPAPKFMAQTRNDADRAAAEVSQGVMRYRDEETRFARKKREIATWAVTGGTVYGQSIEDKANARRFRVAEKTFSAEPLLDKVTGDPIMGPDGVMVTRQVSKPVLDKNGEPVMAEYLTWDEGAEVLTPFEVVPDWTARAPWEMRRYTHFRPRSRDWIGRVYGSDLKKKVKSDHGLDSGIAGDFQLKLLDILARGGATGRFGLPTVFGSTMADWRFVEDSCTVIIRYEMPTDQWPNGRVLACAGDVVLDDSEYTPRFGERLNLYTFRWSVLPGGIWGFGMPRNLIPLQKRLNGIDTQNDLIRKTMGNPQWLVAKRSQFSRDLGTSEPGHVNTYKHSGGQPAPTRLDAKAPPESNFKQREDILVDMQRIGGMMDVLAGVNPAGVTAGVSLELLVEKAGKRFEPAIDDNRDEYRAWYQHRLDMARRSNAWKVGRDVPFVGEDGERDLKKWYAQDFTGNVTVECEAVPITAFSTVVQTQRMLTGVKLGLIDLANSPQNRDRARQLLSLQQFDEAYSLDYKRAQMENEKMIAGEHIERGKWDNDEVHVYVHMRAALSRKWDEYPDDVKAEIQQHLDEHLLRLVPSAGAAPEAGAGSKTPQGMTAGESASTPGATPEPDLEGMGGGTGFGMGNGNGNGAGAPAGGLM